MQNFNETQDFVENLGLGVRARRGILEPGRGLFNESQPLQLRLVE